MPFFANLLRHEPEVEEHFRVALVLTNKDFDALEGLLAKVPYEHAEPIVKAFLNASALQRKAGWLEVVDKVLELHRTAVTYRDRPSIDEPSH